MERDELFDRLAAASALAVAGLSLLYAIAYLGITPSAQRGSDVDDFYRSYLAHPAGGRIASTCLFLSGLLVGLPVVALARRLAVRAGSIVTWASILGVVAGFATAAHGLTNLLAVDKLAHKYESGDAATRAAITVAGYTPSEVDPRGLATFCAAGLAALALGLALRAVKPTIGTLGVVLGVDMVLLFVATAAGIGPLILLTGGLASVILGPWWWVSVARELRAPAVGTVPIADPAAP